jgi:hypothetical protein
MLQNEVAGAHPEAMEKRTAGRNDDAQLAPALVRKWSNPGEKSVKAQRRDAARAPPGSGNR